MKLPMKPVYLDRESVAQAISVSVDTIERLVQRGQFPKPRQLTDKRVGWLVREMEDFRLVVKTRIDAHKVSEDAKEEKIKADAIAAANVVIETAKAIAPTVATSTPIQATAAQIIGITSKSALNAVRVELNGLLDRLNDDQLQRIISFVKSRYPAQAAA